MPITGQLLRDIITGAGVEVLDKGHSVSRGNFNIKCPFCGSADPGHHMGIRLDSGWWGCWRNADHRGKSPVRLLCAVLGKPVWEVRRLLGIHSAPALDTFAGVRDRLRPPDVERPQPARVQGIKVPREFRDDWRAVAAERFTAYLARRGYGTRDRASIIQRFDLMYCLRGDFADRIVIPYTYRRALVTWTARSIHADHGLRYRDLEKDASALFKDQLLFNHDGAAQGGRVLVLLEGPFDVIKGDLAGAPLGVRCVGLSTNSFTDAQAETLAELSSAFDRVAIAMDTPTSFARIDSYRMVSKLRGVVEADAVDASSLGKDIGGASLGDTVALFRRLTHE